MKFVSKKLFSILTVTIVLLSNITFAALNCRKKLRSQSSQYRKKTQAVDWGEGSIFFLDRLNVDVGPKKVLRQFLLYKPTEDQMAYKFDYSESPSISENTYVKYTEWNETDSDEKASIRYLDRHHLKCNNKDMIQQFQLEREGSNGSRIRYKYRCVKVNSRSCLETAEYFFDFHHRSTAQLSKYEMFIPPGYGINSFKLDSMRSVKTIWGYSVKYCRLN